MKSMGMIVLMVLALFAITVRAADTYQSGHINEVTYVHDYVLIRLDNGAPLNCAGTPYGWMAIPPTSKPMLAFVTGLWMRNDAAQVNVTVYTVTGARPPIRRYLPMLNVMDS